jgi:hypothetical protein
MQIETCKNCAFCNYDDNYGYVCKHIEATDLSDVAVGLCPIVHDCVTTGSSVVYLFDVEYVDPCGSDMLSLIKSVDVRIDTKNDPRQIAEYAIEKWAETLNLEVSHYVLLAIV